MSQLDVNSPCKRQPLFPLPHSKDCGRVLSASWGRGCLSRTFGFRLVSSAIWSTLMSCSLYSGSSFHLMAGQLQGLQACRVQPSTCPNRSPGLCWSPHNAQGMWGWSEVCSAALGRGREWWRSKQHHPEEEQSLLGDPSLFCPFAFLR